MQSAKYYSYQVKFKPSKVRFNQILEKSENWENLKFQFGWTGPLAAILGKLSYYWST